MTIVADESVDGQIVLKLRQLGHLIFFISEECPGINDEEVLKTAFTKQSLLITEDKDFGELVFRLKRASFGVLLIRLNGWNSEEKGRFVESVFNQYGDKFLHSFTVVSEDKIRIREV